MKTLFTILGLLFTACAASGQTCEGEVVKFSETFGSGWNRTSLPAGRTNYKYKSSGDLDDGDYILHRSTQGRPEWHNTGDHTGGSNGRMMVTNASFEPGEFYRDTVYGVSSVSTYNIYFYAMNVNTVGTCSPDPILPRLQLVVEAYNFDGSFTHIYSLVSDPLPQTSSPTWVRVSGQFYLPTECTAVRYRIINHSTGGCGNDLAIDDITFSQCNPTLLPVTGLQLRADDNQLHWYTLSEQNTEKFFIEKSSDNRNWERVGTIAAAGNSESRRNYSFTDKPCTGKTFYRVVSVDKNGKSFYSNVVVVKPQSAVGSLSVYPNPANSFVKLAFNLPSTQTVHVRILDFAGRTLRSIAHTGRAGDNELRVDQLEGLGKGMYLVAVADAAGGMVARASLARQ